MQLSPKPAFPIHSCDEASLSTGGTYTTDHGMTLRDYFAAKAMQAYAEPQDMYESTSHARIAAKVAAMAYVMADAMLEARQK